MNNDKRLDKTINEMVQNMHPSGSIVVAMNNEPIYKKSFGYADVANKIPMSIDTQMLIGSLTKQFTAVAILKALFDKNANIEEALNTTIDHYLPEEHEIWSGLMPAWAKIVTLHQLLNHTSGIVNYTSLPDYDKQKLPKTSDIVTFFKSHDLEFTPGSKFSYCNSGYILLGVIAQAITGQAFDHYLEQSFFIPFEMRSTFFPTHGTVDDLIKLDKRFTHLARGYQYQITKQDADLIEISNYVEMQNPGAGGSLISTAADLLRWNNALYSEKIIPKSLLDLMLHPYITIENGKDHYGYGIEIISSETLGIYYNHRGGIPGFHSILTFIPKLNLSIIMLENVVEDRDKLKTEIQEIRNGLSTNQPVYDQNRKIDKILEDKYPNIIQNKNRYQFAVVYDAIIKELGGE